jgi:predicted dehydrogenase
VERIPILVVGCGSIGRRHLQVLAERRDMALAACDPESAARQAVCDLVPDAELFEDLAEALSRWRPQIVVVAAPNHLHRRVTEMSFAAGAHVLCEKPIADTVADGQAMVAAAQASGRVLAVGYTERYRPALEYVQREAASGELGSLIGGRAMVGTYNTLLCAKTGFRQETFGALLVDYTHEFDFLRWIFGDVEEIVARANNLGEKPKRCRPALAATLLRFENGAIVSVHMDYVQHPQRRQLEVYGDRKSLDLDLQTDTVKVFDCERDGYHTLLFDSDRNNRFRAEHQDMICAVLKGTQPRVTGLDAVKALEIAESAIAQIRPPCA